MSKKVIFYDNERLIVGISEIMYKSKWYVVLFKSDIQSFVVIRKCNKYLRLNQYDIEDAKYNDTIEKDNVIILMSESEILRLKESGRHRLKYEYDIHQIYAVAHDMKLEYSKIFSLFFKDKKLVTISPLSSDEYSNIYSKWFIKLLGEFEKLYCYNNRCCINKIMIQYFPSELYAPFNEFLLYNHIHSDYDIAKVILNYSFVMGLIALLDSFDIEL